MTTISGYQFQYTLKLPMSISDNNIAYIGTLAVAACNWTGLFEAIAAKRLVY